MAKFVLVNRRAGLFTDTAKHASRAAVASTLSMFGTQAKVLADHDPSDTLARRVVVFEADAAHVASMRSSLAPDAIIEPLVYRRLHFHRLPGLLRRAVPLEARALRHTEDRFLVTITAGGQPLGGINVMVYLADSFGSVGLEMANMRVLLRRENDWGWSVVVGQLYARIKRGARQVAASWPAASTP